MRVKSEEEIRVWTLTELLYSQRSAIVTGSCKRDMISLTWCTGRYTIYLEAKGKDWLRFKEISSVLSCGGG